MRAYQEGRAEAFEQLYAALAGGLRGYLQARCRDAARAEDLVQDTFLQIHRSRHTYEPGRPVKPWVYAIAHHVYLMDLRARTRRARHEAEPGYDAAAREPATDALVLRHELRDALEQLPPGRREAWLLHHVRGLSFEEVAARLKIASGAARLRSSRAMEQLRGLLRRTPHTEEPRRDE
jgi:RNA polymerase sigma-70 factor (ECF subfamily)